MGQEDEIYLTYLLEGRSYNYQPQQARIVAPMLLSGSIHAKVENYRKEQLNPSRAVKLGNLTSGPNKD